MCMLHVHVHVHVHAHVHVHVHAHVHGIYDISLPRRPAPIGTPTWSLISRASQSFFFCFQL
jgi:hypothetical protein